MHFSDGPLRTLSSLDVICLIVVTVVSAGIFKAPSVVAGHMGSGLEFMLVWMIGGLISVVWALCCAKLATSNPKDGGEYPPRSHTATRFVRNCDPKI